MLITSKVRLFDKVCVRQPVGDQTAASRHAEAIVAVATECSAAPAP